MDQQYDNFLNSIKQRIITSFDKFMLFFYLFSLIKQGVVSVSSRIYMIFAISSLYIISPIDFIPDFIPIIGFLDDLAVLGLVCNSFRGLLTIAKAVIKAREVFHQKSNRQIFEESHCMICLTRKPEVIYNCGHKICCNECQRIGNFRVCFVCRQ